MQRWIQQYQSKNENHAHLVKNTVAIGRTAVQNWEVVEFHRYGLSLLLDGCIQSTQKDEACYHDALHLPAQMACIGAKNVLLIGGANGGSLSRALRLPHLENVTLLDIDEELHQISKQVLTHMHGDSLGDRRINMVFGPPHENLHNLLIQDRRFDIIVADTPDATELSYSSHLFSSEYLATVANLLTDDGIFVTQAGQAHPLDCRFTARVGVTLARLFPETALYTHHVPSFGVPWAFALAGRNVRQIAQADPDWIEARLTHLIGPMSEAYDGVTHRHMFSLPKFLRTAIEHEQHHLAPITSSSKEHVSITEIHHSI